MLNVLLTVAALAAAPAPRGAIVTPDAAAHARTGQSAWTTGICVDDANPSDVTVTDSRGHQYRNGNRAGTRWIDAHGRTVAVRHGDEIRTRRNVWVFGWCG